ncbi:MAG: gamma-aminobutyrate permease, partial [Novosphingobium sp.]
MSNQFTTTEEAEALIGHSDTQLGRSLENRHVTMITLGGIIGAGLFVGSSTTISQVGPAAVISFA